VPTLSIYAQTKTDNLAMVGVVIAQYGLWQALIRLPLGITSDWLGRRKPFIIAGILLAGLGAWVMGTSTTIDGLIIGRAITGLAAGAWVPMIVAFSGLFPPKETVRATAILSLVNSIAMMLATGLTGVFNSLGGYALAFYVSVGVAALTLVIFLTVPEQRQPSVTRSLKNTLKLILRKDVLLPSLLNTLVQYSIFATTFGFLPILAKQLGASGIENSFMVSMNIAVVMLGNLLVNYMVKKVGTRPMTYAGFILIACGLLTAGVAHSLAVVYISQFLIGLGNGIGYPLLMGMSIEKVESNERSTAMGLHQAVYGIGMFAGPWFSGLLANAVGIRWMFAVTAAGLLILGIIGTRFLGTVRQRQAG
jgi:MFS family permease